MGSKKPEPSPGIAFVGERPTSPPPPRTAYKGPTVEKPINLPPPPPRLELLRIENELERKIRQEEADALNNLVRYSCDSTSGIRKSQNGPLVRLREVVDALGLRQAIDGHVEP